MTGAQWFGGRLRELREQAGLTQSGLGERAGLSGNALARLERGERQPLWETVLALAEALGVGVEAFTTPPAQMPKPKRGRPRKKLADQATPATKKGKRK
jgi:transcriptional regulator with XRE-family HTH domain